MRRLLHIVLICVICALAQLRLLQMADQALADNLQFGMKLAWYDQGWHGDRGRLLGVGATHLFGGTFHAYLTVIALSLFIGGLLSWRLAGVRGLAIYHTCFAFFASPWFQPWDMFQPVIFTVFAILVVEKKGVVWFVALFAVAIFDRPSAMFIALWMILSQRMVVAGLVCLLSGLALIWYVQHSGAPRIGLIRFQAIDGYSTSYQTDFIEEHLPENLRQLASPNLLLIGILGSIAYLSIGLMRERLALGLTFLAMVVASLICGIITETRIYLPFIPLFILGAKNGTSLSRA